MQRAPVIEAVAVTRARENEAMLKTFQYRLYPSPPQARKLEATRETCRRWYNELLAERKTAWEEHGA